MLDYSLEQLKDGAVQRKLSEDSQILIKRFAEAAFRTVVKARLQGIGGQFQAYFTAEPVTNDASATSADRFK